jgi:dihydroxyacid dehydratase/phosphogluconate dehydratase
MTLPSRHVTAGMSNALNRIYFHAMGLTREQIARPIAGVATAWHSSSAAGELPLRVARAAEAGVWAGGATPRQFATVASPGTGPLRAGLVVREVVADSVELTIRGHNYDALLGVAADPLALSGLMLAMCRLDVPSVLVPLSGAAFGEQGRELALAAEALGLALPGAADAGATLKSALAAADAAGAELGRRIAEGASARGFVDEDALVAAANGLSDPGLAVHLAALASECGIGLTLAELLPSRWVTGSLAPGGALVTGRVRAASGAARVFDGEPAACEWLDGGGWPAGTVVVIRGAGPAGGHGMPALDGFATAAARVGAPAGALLVTDGMAAPIAGVTGVCAVAPEAAAGGPLAGVRDGDAIRLGASLDAEPPREGAAATRVPLVPVLDKYRRAVGPAAGGATTHPGAAAETVRYAEL